MWILAHQVATFPTTLYLLEKKVSQSSSVPFSLSSRSEISADTSSAFVEVLPRARDASLPANTRGGERVSIMWKSCRNRRGAGWEKVTVIWSAWLIGLITRYIKDYSLFISVRYCSNLRVRGGTQWEEVKYFNCNVAFAAINTYELLEGN